MYMCQQWIENRILSTNTSNVVNVNEHQAEWSRDCIYRTSAHFADVKNHSYESVDPKFRNSPIPQGEESVSNQDTLLFPRSLKLIKINLWQFLQNRFWFVHGDNVTEARIYPFIYTVLATTPRMSQTQDLNLFSTNQILHVIVMKEEDI